MKLHKHHLKILLLLFLMQSVTSISLAQEQHLIHGIIKDELSQVPIKGVNIQVYDTYTGTSTNSNGEFELKVYDFPAILIITHISYIGKQVFFG